MQNIEKNFSKFFSKNEIWVLKENSPFFKKITLEAIEDKTVKNDGLKSIDNKFSNIQIGDDIKIKIQLKLNIEDKTVKNDDNEFSNIQISQMEDNEFENSNSEAINSNEFKQAKYQVITCTYISTNIYNYPKSQDSSISVISESFLVDQAK